MCLKSSLTLPVLAVFFFVGLSLAGQTCHGNFGPLKILVRDKFFSLKMVWPTNFFRKNWSRLENFDQSFFIICLISMPQIDDTSS